LTWTIARHSEQTTKKSDRYKNKQQQQDMLAVFHPEPCGNTSEFTINWTLANKTSETIKWNINKENMKFTKDSVRDLNSMRFYHTVYL
jgi:hypothetical protein